MTSEEISGHVEACLAHAEDTERKESVEFRFEAALFEIAYQLAVMNEREPRPHMDACECGHPFIHHAEIQRGKTGYASCMVVDCRCLSFRPKVTA